MGKGRAKLIHWDDILQFSFKIVNRCHYDPMSQFPLIDIHTAILFEYLNVKFKKKYCHKNINTSHIKCLEETGRQLSGSTWHVPHVIVK